MSNVRFYRLSRLPEFVLASHQGIFVHLTAADTTHKAGLWFGGASGWEYLTNDTNPQSITNAINALDVEGYAQAGITTSTDSSTLTIKGIQEVNGLIGAADGSDNVDFDIAIDGVYNESTNKIATESTVTTAINGLDTEIIQPVTITTTPENSNTTLTFKGVKEIDGKIYQGDGENPSTLVVGDAKLNIEIGTDSFEVFSANAQSNGAIKLDKNVFKKNVVDGKNVLSVITKNNDVSSTNPLVTQKDIDSLAGAMHYRGGVTSVPVADENTKKGDVWVVTTGFEGYEAGDMFIARADGASATFDHVQGNLTLGIGDGQIAKNDGDLVDGKLVVATLNGIRTIDINGNVLNDENNTRNLTITNNSPESAALHHSVAITDNLKIMSREFNKTINISSVNSSIEIVKNPTEGTTGVMLDLVWNTIEP